MMATRTRLITTIGALVAATTLLTGCGGTTVTSEEVDAISTSVAPLERSTQATTGSESSETRVAEPSAGAGVAAPVLPAPMDRGAREIAEIPAQSPARSREDESFLRIVTDHEINVEGVESQLIGAARTVCAEEAGPVNDATLLAVAGQLTAQGRTDLPVEELYEILMESARATYCP